jgi:hypothetical protein
MNKVKKFIGGEWKTTSKKLIENFKDLENQTVKVGESTLKDQMIDVFKSYPETFFTQRNFSERLNKRTQHINHILKELLKDQIILRSGSRKQYFYKLNK